MIGCLQRNENTGWSELWAMGLASQSIGTEVSASAGDSPGAICNLLIIRCLQLSERSQVNPKLLAFFVEVAALES